MKLASRFLSFLAAVSCCCLATKLKARNPGKHAINHGMADPGFSDLLESEEPAAPAPPTAIENKKPKNAAKLNLMEQSMMMLAEQDPAASSGDTKEFVKMMKDALDKMTSDIFDSLKSADTECNSAKNKANAGCPSYTHDTSFGPPGFDGNFEPLRSAHVNCRTEVTQMMEKFHRCSAASEAAFNLEQAAINSFQAINVFESPQECATGHADPETYIDAMVEHFASKETAWWHAYGEMVNRTDNASAYNCEQMKLDYEAKATECNEAQLAFENTACDVWDRTNSSCATIGQCSDDSWNSYSEAVKITNASLEDQALEWRAIQRMHCLVDAFAATDVNAAVDACIAKTYSIEFILKNSTCVNDYEKTEKPEPLVPDVCAAVSCAKSITLSGAEKFQYDMMGTYNRVSYGTSAFNAYYPIYENAHGHSLYFIASHNTWMIGANMDTQNMIGGIYGYGGDTRCPEDVLYWIVYTYAGWKWFQGMTFQVAQEDPSHQIFSGMAIKYPGRSAFRTMEYTDKSISAGPCLATCCKQDPYLWILHSNAVSESFYVPPGGTGEYASFWEAKQACEAATELVCMGIYLLGCSFSKDNPVRLIAAGGTLVDSSVKSCLYQMKLGTDTTVTTTLPPQLCTYKVKVSRSDKSYDEVWRSYDITRQNFDERFVFSGCTTEGHDGEACVAEGVSNGVRVLTNKKGVGVAFGSCCHDVTNKVLSSELVACNGFFNDYSRMNDKFVVDGVLSKDLAAHAAEAKDRCMRLGPLCWGIMDDGCDGTGFGVIESSHFTVSTDLRDSSEGSCVYQKKVDPEFDSFPPEAETTPSPTEIS